eukprot:340548_1
MSQVNQRVTEQSLQSLLPNGLCKSRKLTETESNKINGKVIKSKQQYITPTNKCLLICIKGKCRQSLNLYNPKTIKATNWISKHLKKVHKNEDRTHLDEEILIHSFFTVSGKGDFQQYKDHFLLINITGYKKFQYFKNNTFHGLFDQNINNTLTNYEYYPEIDLATCKSSKYSARKPAAVPEPPTPPTSPEQINDNNEDSVAIDRQLFDELMNKLLVMEIKIDKLKNDKNKITSFTAPIVRQQSRKSQIKQPHYKYRIPVATNGMTMKIFSTKEGKYIFAISFNINDELYHGRCILCHRWRLKFIHDLQQGTAENETSMETCASEVGGIYTPNRRAFLNETLKKKFINKRTLSRNLKIRRKLVRKVIKYHRKHYKGTGLLKHKRKTNVKYSTSLDRLEHLQDDRMGVIDDNDLCPSEKNFECEYD